MQNFLYNQNPETLEFWKLIIRQNDSGPGVMQLFKENIILPILIGGIIYSLLLLIEN